MTVKEERDNITACVNEAVEQGARKEQACKIIGLTARTIQRWQKNPYGDQRLEFKRVSSKALTHEEKDRIVEICNSSEYKDMTPNEIVPILAEKGEYYASESTFYRVLREKGLLTYRSDCKPANSVNKPDELKATGPNQVWSWDITYLKTCVRGIYYYLYLFMDVWSRLIVGWTVEKFVKWYNEEHHHSGIKFVTPMQRHIGDDDAILQKRKETYIAARNSRPDRWSGNIRNWDRIEEVYLNKKIEQTKIKEAA